MAAKDITNQQLLDALTEQLGVITDNMVTKDELKRELDRLEKKIDRLELKMDSKFVDLQQGLALAAGLG